MLPVQLPGWVDDAHSSGQTKCNMAIFSQGGPNTLGLFLRKFNRLRKRLRARWQSERGEGGYRWTCACGSHCSPLNPAISNLYPVRPPTLRGAGAVRTGRPPRERSLLLHLARHRPRWAGQHNARLATQPRAAGVLHWAVTAHAWAPGRHLSLRRFPCRLPGCM